MGQSFYPLTPVDVSPAITGSWQDVACAAYIPAGATGVILHIVNEDTGDNRIYSLRKKGSTDDRKAGKIANNGHSWAAIGVDSNRELQAYIETTDVKIYLTGYTKSGVTFFTNAYDKSLTIEEAWTTIACSAEAPNAIGLIFEIYDPDPTAWRYFGLRKKGSTDDRYNDTLFHLFAIVGCNGSQEIEGYTKYTELRFYLVGYVTEGAVFKTNADDKSLAVAGSYQDIDCSEEAPGAVMLFFEVTLSGSPYNYALRKDNTRPDIYLDNRYHCWALIECTDSQHCEGKVCKTSIKIHLVGYAAVPVGPTIETQNATGIKFDQAILATKVTDDQGKTLSVRHNYGKTTAYGKNTPWREGKHTNDLITQTVTELEPDTMYHFRGEATYVDGTPGTVYGADKQFTTLPGPTIETQDATAIKSDQATLATKVLDDKGKTLSVRHNYGETTAYGKNTPWQEGKHTNDVISQTVTELEPETEYHFRGEAIYED